jgi:hypothetical protein
MAVECGQENFGKGVAMKRGWMKWAAVAAVGMVAVPVMAMTILPSKTPAKKVIAAKPVAHQVSHVSTAAIKKTTAAARPVTKSLSPRPASVRLGKNVPVKTTKSAVKSSTLSKAKPVIMTKTPIRPTTLHAGPAKLPVAKTTLGKAMAKTHTVSAPKATRDEPVNVLSKSGMN